MLKRLIIGTPVRTLCTPLCHKSQFCQ